MGAHFLWFEGVLSRKDAFPGADGSTITQVTGTNQNAETIPIYGADGNQLEEGEGGLSMINITTLGIINNNNSLEYTIKHPIALVYNTIIPRDWYSNMGNRNDALWGDGEAKSAYEPCPNGWRVPANGSFDDFLITSFTVSGSGTNITNGRTYQSIAWFPAAGFRASDNGALGRVGFSGYSWSATANDTDAYNLGFNETQLNSNSSNARAVGFPIRCVQE